MKGLPARKSKPGEVTYDYRRYVRLSIQLSHWLLRPMGVWPTSAESPWMMKYVDILINVFCTGLISFIFVPCVLYVVFEVEDTYSTLKFSGPLSYLLMVTAKYYSLISHETDLRRCIEHIESDWMNTRHYSDRAIMIKNAEFGRRLVAICTFFTYGGLAFYHVALPISRGKITEEDSNLTYQPLVYPIARMILDTRYSPISEIFFWVQCLAGFFAQSVLAASCGLAATLAMHAHGRLEVLMEWLLHLVDGREDFSDNVDKRLAMIVQQHVQILRFISLIEKILHEISLVETVGCTLNMCFLGYYVIMETGEIASYVTYIILLISFTLNIFIFCYIGELVAEQSKRVSEISYMIDWHRIPGKKAVSITLVIAISNSIKLTAGNLIKLSLTSFGDVVKASVAYLNMLRTLTT